MISDEQAERLISLLEQLNSSNLTVSDLLAMSAVGISIVSIIVAVGIFRAQQKFERRRYTTQLHDWYWSAEMREIREGSYAIRAQWKASGDQSAFVESLLSKGEDGENTSEWRKVSRLLFFFSDIERQIRMKTVDQELAIEMFGDAQYGWFSDFFAAVRDVVEERHQGQPNPPSWIARTKALEELIQEFGKTR